MPFLDVLQKVTENKESLIQLVNAKLSDNECKQFADALQANSVCRILYLAGLVISETGTKYLAEAISKAKDLYGININDIDISEAGIKYLADAIKTKQTLKDVLFFKMKFTPLGIKYLADAIGVNAHVLMLGFTDCNLGNAGIKLISEAMILNSNLTSFSLRDPLINAEGVAYLADAFRTSKELRFLSIRDTPCGNVGIKHLAEALKGKASLKVLSLISTGMDHIGTNYLVDALNVSSLEELGVEGNKLGVKGAKSVARLLTNPSSLIRLDLGNCHIGNHGVQYLTKPLKSHQSTLKTLRLLNNGIGDIGAKPLAEMMVNNHFLTEINLYGNSITDVGGQYLLDALTFNFVIERLIINDSPMSQGLKDTIDQKLKQNYAAKQQGLLPPPPFPPLQMMILNKREEEIMALQEQLNLLKETLKQALPWAPFPELKEENSGEEKKPDQDFAVIPAAKHANLQVLQQQLNQLTLQLDSKMPWLNLQEGVEEEKAEPEADPKFFYQGMPPYPQEKGVFPPPSAPDIVVPDDYRCSITGLIMREAVNNSLHQTYEREALERWLETKNTDPQTNEPLPHKRTTENLFAKKMITSFLDANPALKHTDEIYLPKRYLENLKNAILNQNLNEVKQYLQLEKRLLSRYLAPGRTAFHAACEVGTPAILEYIRSALSQGELNILLALPRPANWHPLALNQKLLADASLGNVEKIQEALRFGAELETQDVTGKTPLCLAAAAGKNEAVAALLAKNANISARDKEGQAPLDLAVAKGHDDVIHQLLDKGLPTYKPAGAGDPKQFSYMTLQFAHRNRPQPALAIAEAKLEGFSGPGMFHGAAKGKGAHQLPSAETSSSSLAASSSASVAGTLAHSK